MRTTPIRAVALCGVLALAGVVTFAAPRSGIAQKANPCALKTAGAVTKDTAAEAAFKDYKGWKKVNEQPVKSASHGNTVVVTYLNKKAEPAAMSGTFPFPAGSIVVKEAFEDRGGKPGGISKVFVMEKRAKGYDSANGDWHYAVVMPDGAVAVTGDGRAGSPTQLCGACHQAAKANDYVFGSGTTMKVKPVSMK
ncbi:MAG: cytochrome P460 family protein [Candidatus Rokubacteria bacterium]|nr:cytochrome P460 family protein [Candidatus Rokubacteria bacterium]